MKQGFADDGSDRELLLAGQRTRPGNYQELGTGRTITLKQEDALPATLDGRVACYIRLDNTWAQIASRRLRRTEGD